jgi:hypothetical protein
VAQAPVAPPTVILPHPQSSLQAGIAVAHDAIGSLGAQPVLLLIVVINVVFIAVGGFFLSKLEATRGSLMLSTLDIVKTCVVMGAPGAP